MSKIVLGALLASMAVMTALACGSSEESTGGGSGGSKGGSGGASGTAGSAQAGSGGSAQAGSGGSAAGADGGGGAAGADCTGTHPLVDGGDRFCAPGQCRCVASDLCFLQSVAGACCDGKIECFTGDGGVECTGTHPLVDGSTRYCDVGACYCKTDDTCFPAAIAQLCCGGAADCA